MNVYPYDFFACEWCGAGPEKLRERMDVVLYIPIAFAGPGDGLCETAVPDEDAAETVKTSGATRFVCGACAHEVNDEQQAAIYDLYAQWNAKEALR